MAVHEGTTKCILQKQNNQKTWRQRRKGAETTAGRVGTLDGTPDLLSHDGFERKGPHKSRTWRKRTNTESSAVRGCRHNADWEMIRPGS